VSEYEYEHTMTFHLRSGQVHGSR